MSKPKNWYLPFRKVKAKNMGIKFNFSLINKTKMEKKFSFGHYWLDVEYYNGKIEICTHCRKEDCDKRLNFYRKLN